MGECDQKALYREPQPKQVELGEPHRRGGGWNARDRVEDNIRTWCTESMKHGSQGLTMRAD